MKPKTLWDLFAKGAPNPLTKGREMSEYDEMIVMELITKRLRELEEIGSGERVTVDLSCGVCSPLKYRCDICPLNYCYEGDAANRRTMLANGTTEGIEQIAQAHIRFIVRLLRKNGYDYI